MHKSVIKTIAFALIAFCGLTTAVAQNDFKTVVDQIIMNNNQIKSGDKAIQSQILGIKRELIPENPEFEFEYLPSTTVSDQALQKFGITQSFEFPSVYFKKKNWIKSQEELLISQQKGLIQQLRYDISDQLIQWVFLQKKSVLLNQRIDETEQMLNAYEQMFDAGEINILQVNQIRIRLQKIIQEKRDLESVVSTFKQDLNALNGGNELPLDVNDYPVLDVIDPIAQWNDIESSDQRLILTEAQNKSAYQKIAVQKHAYLPDLKLGLGSEKTADEHFRGVVFGMSIPLWGKINTVKQAMMEADATMEYGFSTQMIIKAEYAKANHNALNIARSKDEFEKLIQALSQKELLNKMLNNGAISLSDYLVELESYYELQNQLIELEMQLFHEFNILNRYKY
ncbi:MAG: TolC family protein [Bacteroidales bacterium]|nr:TolC family protein [Bacteroidales bacterium]